ncbi:MAG TPA: hypothetical protein VIM71_03795 [Lacunisphaera sp.]
MLSLTAVSLAPAARADLNVDITADIRIGRALPPPPPEVVVVEEVGPPGPPPWAHTHWYRRSHAYYYYPGFDVYYRPADRVWFYLDGGTWRIGAQLPTSIRVDFNRAVPLTLESDRPYVFHEKVVTYYPSNYFAKVRFKEDHDNRPGHFDDRRDRDDHHDHDKGRGKDKRKH